MTRIKQLITAVIGIVVAVYGAWLRLSAYDIAWPRQYSYSGPRENTVWAIKERAYQDVGLILLIFGLVVLLAALIHWLWESSASRDK